MTNAIIPVSQSPSCDSVQTISNYLESVENSVPIKWKNSEILANQAVLFFDKYIYKVYIELKENEFNSRIRHCLADIYKNDYNLDWEIQTLITDTSIIDVERREKLEVINDESFYDKRSIYMNSFSILLKKLERSLNLEAVLPKVKEYFPDTKYIKLIRDCIPKSIDYALVDNKVVLLDDADWVLMLFDKNGNKISENNYFTNLEIPVKLYEKDAQEYLLTRYIKSSNMKVEKVDSPTSFLFLYKKDDSGIVPLVKKTDELRLTRNKMIYNIAETLVKCDMKEENMDILVNEENDKLYTNNTGRKSFQWELWPACNSQCKFCYLGEENKKTTTERQLISLENLDKEIDTLDFNVYNNISIIGGEFFQGQLSNKMVHDKFFSVLGKVFKLYANKKIGSIWITATLTLGDQKDLYDLLTLAENNNVFPAEGYGASGLWICTSWDSKGRFHNDTMKNNWEFHMKNIKKKFPWVKLNTTIILSQDFIEKYLNDEFKPHAFMDEFDTCLFYKQCGIPSFSAEIDKTMFIADESKTNEDILITRENIKQAFQKKIGFPFFPKRETFLQFLTKYYNEDQDTFERLFNILFRADDLHRNFNDCTEDIKISREKDFSKPEVEGIATQKCGHVCDYAPYIDSDRCCICDRELVTGRGI